VSLGLSRRPISGSGYFGVEQNRLEKMEEEAGGVRRHAETCQVEGEVRGLEVAASLDGYRPSHPLPLSLCITSEHTGTNGKAKAKHKRDRGPTESRPFLLTYAPKLVEIYSSETGVSG
jgi:hypothetical protein